MDKAEVSECLNKYYAIQKVYCRLMARSDGLIYCVDCFYFDSCKWRIEHNAISGEYCERFVRKKVNKL